MGALEDFFCLPMSKCKFSWCKKNKTQTKEQIEMIKPILMSPRKQDIITRTVKYDISTEILTCRKYQNMKQHIIVEIPILNIVLRRVWLVYFP